MLLTLSATGLFAYDLSKIQWTKGIQEFNLKNGLKVYIKEEHSVPLVGVAVMYKSGFRTDDINGHSGLSHLLEHMLFKSTKNFMRDEIDKQLTEFGADFNGFTSYDKTLYYEVLPVAGLETAIRIEADRMNNALFLPDEFKTEVGVVLSELRLDETDPGMKLSRAIETNLWGKHPFAYSYGTLEDVGKADRDYLFNEVYKKFYCPNNAVLVIVGDISAKDAMAMVETYFGGFAANPKLPAEKLLPLVKKPGVHIQIEGVAKEDFGYQIFFLPKYDENDPEYYTLSFIQDSGIVGGMGYWATPDGGMAYMDYSQQPDYPAETLNTNLLMQNFEYYKNKLIYQELLGYDSIKSIMMNICGYARYGTYKNYEKAMAYYDKLTAPEVVKAILKYFSRENCSTAFFKATKKDARAVPQASSQAQEGDRTKIDLSEFENPTPEALAKAKDNNKSFYKLTIASLEKYLSTVKGN